jgi:hypothetical protein
MNEQHLYQVSIRHTNGDLPREKRFILIGTLNIVVAKESIGAALTKARKFLSQNKAKYPDAVITGISHHGTIDNVEDAA